MTFFKTFAAAALVSASFATGASALTFGNIPGGGDATNEGVQPIYGTDSRDGYYGANLSLIGGGGTATITIDYLGSEALNNNKFFFQGVEIFATGGDTDIWPGVGDSVDIANVADGLLDFSFTTHTGGSVDNGANPDDAAGTSNINFFATLVSNPEGVVGQAWDLWFDDGGAGNDDNHDDMAIRISVSAGSIAVPVPAAGLLLLGGLGALGAMKRRSKKKS